VTTGLVLGEFATTPLYNIKAVVQATNISPSTLRAWERRYDIARPQRSESGYRLYSERDIAVIRWLKAQVEAGMSISQAASWLGTITESGAGMEHAVLPVAGSSAPLHDHPHTTPSQTRQSVRGLAALHNELMLGLLQFDEDAAEAAIAEAFAIYPVEQVGDKLFIPLLAEMSERGLRGDFGPTAEHFASNYLIHRLGTLLRSIPNGVGTPLLWVGCARTELHEVGALLVCIYLRRAGYYVHYLGQNLPIEEEAVKDLVREARRHQPAMILFCANTPLAAERVGQLSARLVETNHLPAIIGYCGAIYTRNPELRAATAGVYIGSLAHEVVQNINELLADKHRADRKYDKKGYINQTVADRIAATK
jgi:MerR family transcriptional regulator, light-induced transcriptional regulator